ncbi:IS5 family transposase [Streptomyces sp. NPDC050392]|uniref:IS5 family transposase n=1 Tax=Streptomyces sp. NPDC050392 TaxID=3155782 RepID=UPI003419C9F6
MVDAVAFKYRNNLAWCDVPDECPPWQTVSDRFTRWSHDGSWHRVLVALQARADADGDLDCLAGVDSTVARAHQLRAHQHAADAAKMGAPAGESGDHAPGRTRGGLSTNLHLVTDARCRPITFVVAAGQAGDAPQFERVMAAICVTVVLRAQAGPLPVAWVAADAAYDRTPASDASWKTPASPTSWPCPSPSRCTAPHRIPHWPSSRRGVAAALLQRRRQRTAILRLGCRPSAGGLGVRR